MKPIGIIERQVTVYVSITLTILVAVSCQKAPNQKALTNKDTSKYFKFSDLDPKHKLRRTNVEEAPSFYQHIDEAAESARLQPLNAVQLGRNDFELRIWLSPGAAYLIGARICKLNGQWERGMIKFEPKNLEHYLFHKLPEPKQKWEGLLSQIEQEAVTDLRPCKNPQSYPDSAMYLVEIISKGKYKNFMYPPADNCADLKKIEKLFDTILAD